MPKTPQLTANYRLAYDKVKHLGLSTKEFTTFLDNIYLFASETLGIILPKPDDIGFNEFYINYLSNS